MIGPRRIAAGLKRRVRRWAGIEPYRIDASRFVAEISPMQLPATSDLWRIPPRPPEHRQPGYIDGYDAVSVFYDVFWNGRQVVFSGPPLANLAEHVLPALRFDGRPAVRPPLRHQFDRTDITVFDFPRRPRRIDLAVGGAQFAARVLPDGAALFAGAKALVTLSLNNDLEWIEDWVDFYVRAHGVDAVVFYDNGSERYSPKELLSRLAAVPGIGAAVVVPWPFAFGPGGDPTGKMWDSDYCQHAMIEHARRRFLRDAAVIFQVDIDELVVTPRGSSVDELLRDSASGALLFNGRWLRYVDTGLAEPPPRRHRSHIHYLDDADVATPKWIAAPSRIPDDVQMGVHGFVGDFVPTRADHPMLRHFRAISTSWKYNRSQVDTYDPQRHIVDEEWISEMRRIGWRE